MTAGGAIVSRTYDITTDRLGRSNLAFLVGSPHRVSVLTRLRNQPERIADFTDLSEEGPSRSTLHRTMSAFWDRDWVDKNGDGCYELTPTRESTIRTYHRFEKTITQVYEKNACLRNCGVACEELPAHHLEGERVVTSTPTNPFKGRNAYLNFLNDLDEDSIDYVRMFSTYFDAEFAEAFSPFIKAGVTVDVVSPDDVLGKCPSGLKELRYIKQGFTADHVQWHIYSGTVPCGLVIFDDEWAVLGPGDLDVVSRVSASIFAADDEIVQWAITLFDKYLDDSDRPPGDALQRIYQKLNKAFSVDNVTQSSLGSNR